VGSFLTTTSHWGASRAHHSALLNTLMDMSRQAKQLLSEGHSNGGVHQAPLFFCFRYLLCFCRNELLIQQPG